MFLFNKILFSANKFTKKILIIQVYWYVKNRPFSIRTEKILVILVLAIKRAHLKELYFIAIAIIDKQNNILNNFLGNTLNVLYTF